MLWESNPLPWSLDQSDIQRALRLTEAWLVTLNAVFRALPYEFNGKKGLAQRLLSGKINKLLEVEPKRGNSYCTFALHLPTPGT